MDVLEGEPETPNSKIDELVVSREALRAVLGDARAVLRPQPCSS
jgi:hypothetical protein